MLEPRFKVVKGSESGHCCFEATVLDRDKFFGEFFEIADAERVAAALNALEKEPNVIQEERIA